MKDALSLYILAILFPITLQEFYTYTEKSSVGFRGSKKFSWAYNLIGSDDQNKSYKYARRLASVRKNPMLISYLYDRFEKLVELCRVNIFTKEIFQTPEYYQNYVYSCDQNSTTLYFMTFSDLMAVDFIFEIGGVRLKPVVVSIDFDDFHFHLNESDENTFLLGNRYRLESEYFVQLNSSLLMNGWKLKNFFVCDREDYACVNQSITNGTILFKESEIKYLNTTNQIQIKSPNHTILGFSVGVTLKRNRETKTASRRIILPNLISMGSCSAEGLSLILNNKIKYTYAIFRLYRMEIVDILMKCEPSEVNCTLYTNIPIFESANASFLKFLPNFEKKFHILFVTFPETTIEAAHLEDLILDFDINTTCSKYLSKEVLTSYSTSYDYEYSTENASTISLMETSTNSPKFTNDDNNNVSNNSFFTTNYYTVNNETISPSTPFKEEYNSSDLYYENGTTIYSNNLSTQDVNSTSPMNQSTSETTIYTETQNSSITPPHQQQNNITEVYTESYSNSSGLENGTESLLFKTKLSNISIDFSTFKPSEILNTSERTTSSIQVTNSTDELNNTNLNSTNNIPEEQTNTTGNNFTSSTTQEFSSDNTITLTSKTTNTPFSDGKISTKADSSINNNTNIQKIYLSDPSIYALFIGAACIVVISILIILIIMLKLEKAQGISFLAQDSTL